MRHAVSLFSLFALLLAASPADAVYSCGGVEDTCPCGAYNPYPCCDNGGNCTWYAWHSACCHWDIALPGWGNANTWAQYAAANPNFEVLASPVVGSIAARTLGTYGHVAFVTAVSGSTITVEEENCCTACAAGVRTWTYEASYFDAGFIIPAGGVVPPACSIEIAGTPVVIDDQTDCFERFGTYWWDEAVGTDSHAYYTYATDDSAPDSWASWRLNVTVAGNYGISVMVPASANDLTRQAVYVIAHQGAESQVPVDQAALAGQWVSLGEYWLDEGTTQYVTLYDNTGENADLRRTLLFDAIAVEPVAQCEDECDTVDEVVCDGEIGFRVCGEYDGDECLEWSAVQYCGTGEVCTEGVCHEGDVTCEDECAHEGQECAGAAATHVCGQFDDDPCLEYGSYAECAQGKVCVEGVCDEIPDGGVDGGTSEPSASDGCGCRNAGTRRRPSWTGLLPVVVLLTFVILWFKKRKRHRDDD